MRQFTSKAFGPARKHKYLETCRWVLIGACFMGASSRFKACNEVIVLDPNARAGFSSGTPTPTVTASATPTATVTLTPTPTPTETATPTPDLFFFSAGNETNNSGNGSGATAGNSGGNSGASSGTTGSSTNSNGNSATQALRGSGSWDSANSPSDSDSLGGAGADDADLDGMSDADEETYLTNPHLPDTDGDGYLDGFELANGSSPTDPSSFPAQSYYPPVPLGVSPEFDPRDRDGDGLLNLVEEELSLNPDKADTDGDSIFDGAELLSGTSAHEANQLVDTDSDGLSDEAELRFGTSPTNPDTDGDGLSDAYEILYGYNPLNPGTGGGIVDGRLPASARNYRFKNSGFHFNQ